MSYSNDALLESFLGSRRLSPKSEEGYMNALDSYRRILDSPMTEASKETLLRWYRHISKEEKAASTILKYTDCLRILYRFHLEYDLNLDEDEAEIRAKSIVKRIPLRDLRAERKKNLEMRNKLILPMEFDALMKATKHPRLKAEWAVLYESGCRKGEIIGEKGLKIRDVTFGQKYVECRVNGKTGERTIPLVRSVPYLRAWLQIHPDRNNPDAPLFCSAFKGKIKPINPDTLNVSLSRICKVAGIRHIHPHMLRHTRLTDLAKQGVGEYQLKSFAGWTPNSNMAAIYIHLAGRDHIDSILNADGVQVEKAREERPRTLLENINCPNCGRAVGRDMPYCSYCGFILDDAIGVTRTQGSQIIEKTDFDEVKQSLAEIRRENAEMRRELDELKRGKPLL